MKEFFSTLSLKAKLVTAFLFVGILPALIISLIALNKTALSLEEEAFLKLNVISKTKTVQIEDLFNTMSGQIKTLSTNRLTIDAMKGFRDAFSKHAIESKAPKREMTKQSLAKYYRQYFSEKYKKNNNGEAPEHMASYLDQLNDDALSLQYSYISENSNPLGSKHLLSHGDNPSSYSEMHKKYHSSFKNYLEEFGYYDIFLVDAKTGDIVYSVFKELDFATSLKTGPYVNTNFAKVFEKSLNQRNRDFVGVVDLEPYFPSYNHPAGFLSSPIYDGDTKVGVLIFQLPVEKINKIMTNNQKWKETGLGKTGESYLVGTDGKMRSSLRQLLEFPEDFKKELQKMSISEEDKKYILSKETTAIYFQQKHEGFEQVKKDKNGSSTYKNAIGEEVLGAYHIVNILGMDWFVFAEQEKSEILSSVSAIFNWMLIIGFFSVIAIIGVSFLYSHSLSNKIIYHVNNLRRSAAMTQQSSHSVNEASQEVSSATTQQASAIQETVATLDEISAMVEKSVEYAGKSGEKTAECSRVASEGQQLVNNMIRSIEGINNSNNDILEQVNYGNQGLNEIISVIREIAEKTKVINDIVFQTKLLSFNASVEAARAGEHGKGFAVVAEEVGNLAQMSGNASTEIAEMLENSIKKVADIVEDNQDKIGPLMEKGKEKVSSGVELAKESGRVLEQVVTTVDDVNRMMEDIVVSSKEQSNGVKNIAVAMNEISESTDLNANSAQRSSSYSKQLSVQAGTLSHVVVNLECEILGKSQAESEKKESVVELLTEEKKVSLEGASPVSVAEDSDDEWEEFDIKAG